MLARIQPDPPRLAFTCRDDTCYPVEAAGDTAVSALFWSGAIDLTGDGRPEIVRRAGEQVTIYQEGTAVWQSPAAWRVVVLEDQGDAQSIAVWHWQGWSFSLVWRSQHGHYRNLVLLQDSVDRAEEHQCGPEIGFVIK